MVFRVSWQQKVVSVFKFGRPKSNFFLPKITKIGRFQVPKILKQRPLFVANYPQIWWNRLLFHMNIIFGRVLGKFWKSHILGSFLANFPAQSTHCAMGRNGPWAKKNCSEISEPSRTNWEPAKLGFLKISQSVIDNHPIVIQIPAVAYSVAL